MDHASRMNCACVQASGVAENVGSPDWKSGPVPAGGWWCHTCSGSSQLDLSRERAIVSRSLCAPSPGASRYSPIPVPATVTGDQDSIGADQADRDDGRTGAQRKSRHAGVELVQPPVR
jgi:hypothetical protein